MASWYLKDAMFAFQLVYELLHLVIHNLRSVLMDTEALAGFVMPARASAFNSV